MPDIEPIPYFASLAKELHGPTLALVLTYLEIHHAPEQDPDTPSLSLSGTPDEIDCDDVCAALGISRRTLHIALNCLGTWFKDESERSRAQRAGREFLNPFHKPPPKGHGQTKFYSVTGSKAWQTKRSLTIRRNQQFIDSLLKIVGISTHNNHLVENVEDSPTLLSLRSVAEKTVQTWGDRRADRWERWRREHGKKSRNPGRMRYGKNFIGSSTEAVSTERVTGCESD